MNLDPDHVRRYDSIEDACAADEVLLRKELGLEAVVAIVVRGHPR